MPINVGRASREKEREEAEIVHLSFATRPAVPRAVLELRPKQCACISPIRTATGALSTAGSELRKGAPRGGYWGQVVSKQRS